jgi:hypothetical protein
VKNFDGCLPLIFLRLIDIFIKRHSAVGGDSDDGIVFEFDLSFAAGFCPNNIPLGYLGTYLGCFGREFSFP